MRTGATELIKQMDEAGVTGQEAGGWVPDVIMATSLLSLGDLRAQLPPQMRSIPCMLYMHENQVAYPFRTEHGAGGERDLQYPVTNLMSVLAADQVIWNSRWNLDSFCDGIDGVLAHCPDGTLGESVADQVRARSTVMWPPVIDAGGFKAGDRVLHNVPVVVWPHRWEHDKGPDGLLDIAREARGRGHELQWILLGESKGVCPESLATFLQEFKSNILHAGWVESHEQYLRMLQQADWVLSTADHEFFGIAVAEAILAGCLPWLPDRLSYPEITPEVAHGISPMDPPENVGSVRDACRRHLELCVAPRAVAELDGRISQIAG